MMVKQNLRSARTPSASSNSSSSNPTTKLASPSPAWPLHLDTFRAATTSTSHVDTLTEAESEPLDRRNSRSIARLQTTSAKFIHYKQVDQAPSRQAQMYNTFLQLHFGSDAAKADMVSRRSYLLALPDWELFSAPLLRHAIFTVCYAHLGVIHQDERLVQESQISYGRVLRSLGQELSRKPEHQDPTLIIPSIMLLTLYDDPLPSPQSRRGDWAAHYEGVLSYIKARGASNIDLSSPSHRLLFTNLRVPSIFIGLAKRKGTTMGESDWLDTMKQHRMQARPRAAFYDMILSVPRLLEVAENLIKGEFCEADTVSLCGQIVKMKSDLHNWLSMASSVAGGFLRELERSVVHLSDKEHFNFDIEEHLVMSTNTTFHSFYNLRGERRSEELSMYWMICLILDCTLLRVLHWRPEMSKHVSEEVQTSLRRDGLDHARSLCRLVYNMCQSQSQGDTAYLRLLVSLAKNYFEETGTAKEAGWCQAVAIATGMRMDRLMRSQPRSLCRMADLVTDISSLACFQMRPGRMPSQEQPTSSSGPATTPHPSKHG